MYSNGSGRARNRHFVIHAVLGLWLLCLAVCWPGTASAQTIVLTPVGISNLKAGQAYSQQLNASGGTAPYTFALGGGDLPAGLTLFGSTLSGTPTHRGTYSFTIRATDNTGATGDRIYSGTVAAPSLSLIPASATAIQGVPFSQPLATYGGVAPHTYVLESGFLPPGLSLSNVGVISGTTSAAVGSYALTLRVTDGSTGLGSYYEVKPFTLTVSPAPSVSIAVSPAKVDEDGATNLVYTVTRSVNLPSPTVVNLTTGGTATSGVDYTGAVTSLTIPANATTATLVIDPIADIDVEPNETVTITVAAGSGYTVGTPASATGTIDNDDDPTLSINDVTVTEGNAGTTNATLTVSLSAASAKVVTVNFATANGSAIAPDDYTSATGTLVFSPGEISKTISVEVNGDTIAEANETFVVNLSAPSNATLADGQGVVTITDDDQPWLSINDVSLNEGNSGTTSFTFTVLLSAPAGPGGVRFNIATADGTAKAGSDYVAKALDGQVIPAGSTNYTFTVLVNGDTFNELNETFLVNVSNVSGATVADGQGVGSINNDDAVPTLAIDDVTVTEGNAGTTDVTLTVSLSAASGLMVTVNYATADGSAVAPGDYTGAMDVLVFLPGETTKTITVQVNGDTIAEADETFVVNLSTPNFATLADAQGVVTITNDDQPLKLETVGLPNPTAGVAYSQTLVASGGSGSYSFAITAGVVPQGMSLSAGGVLAGTPTRSGPYSFTVTAKDTSAAPGPLVVSQAYSITVLAPSLTLPGGPLPAATLSEPYTATAASASGGTEPYTYVISAGSLPTGMSMAASGGISGTPSALGTYNFTVTVTDSTTGTGAPYSLGAARSITVLDSLPVAGPVSAAIAYGASTTPITLVLSGGAAHSVAIDAAPAQGTATVVGSNVISYQPAAGFAGSDSFTYTASNNTGTSAPATVSITVGNPAITVTASGAFSAVAGTAYSQTFTWTGGASPYGGFQVDNLPAGLAVTASTTDSVTISGIPVQAGGFNLDVSATDSSTGNGPFTGRQNFILNVASPSLAMSPAVTTLNVAYGAPYSQVFSAGGGVGPYTFAATGSLPPGVTFSGATLSGTPTTPGSYPVTVTATDTGAFGASTPFAIAVNYTLVVSAPPITLAPASLPDTTAGIAYSQILTANGGVAPHTFAITAGALPAGLALAADGTLSGTSTASGMFNFTITATDDHGQSASRAYAVDVGLPTLVLAPGTLPAASAGTGYSQTTFVASGGIAPYVYSVSGSLPTGLAFDPATASLSGTPTQAGSFPVTITATDSTTGTPATLAQAYTLEIAAPVLAISPASLANGTAGSLYAQVLAASGGIAPYSYVLSGNLPTGLAFDPATASLSGTPTQAGSFPVTITVTDSTTGTAATLAQAYTLEIAAPVLTISPASLANGTAGSLYAQVLAASGGIAPYSYVLSGSLPAGLAFDPATASLSGTPTQAGSFALELTVTDSTTGTAASLVQSYVLDVAVPVISLSPGAGALPQATRGSHYEQRISASGGIAPYRFVASGELPRGISLDADSGVLAGTAEQAGQYSLQVEVSDSTGGTVARATQTYQLEVVQTELVITPDSLPGAVYGQAYRQQLTVSGGSAPYQYTVAAGSLPGGLSLSADGQLSGSLAEDGDFSFRIRVADALGNQAEQAYVLQVALRPDPTRDAEVRALLGAQVQAARRFASAQSGNFKQRMQRLHGASGNGGFSNNLSLAASGAGMPACDAVITVYRNDGRCDPQRRQPFDHEPAAVPGVQAENATELGLWLGGSVRSGRDSNTRGRGTDFQTDGLSLGADYRFGKAWVAGAGVGYGSERSDVGNLGSRSDGQALSMVLYASYSPGQRLFVDALAGYQLLDYQWRRHVLADGSFVHGQRDGQQWFGSLSLGADIARGDWQFTPYAGVELVHGSLDRFAETGNPLYNLVYAEQQMDAVTGNAGLRLQVRRQADWGIWSPRMGLEYQHDFQGSGMAGMQYSNASLRPWYQTRLDRQLRNRWLLGIGVDLELGHQWGLRMDYNGLIDADNRDNGVQFNLERRL